MTEPATQGDPFAVFRPRRGRLVAIVLAVAAIVVFTTIGVTIASSAINDYQVTDRVFIASLGWAMAALFWRYATIKAVPSREGLLVRNLIRTTEVAWPQVLELTFDGGMPWPSLTLNDFDTLAVMAIQRSDGPSSLQEAARLAALIHALGQTQHPDLPPPR